MDMLTIRCCGRFTSLPVWLLDSAPQRSKAACERPREQVAQRSASQQAKQALPACFTLSDLFQGDEGLMYFPPLCE